MPKIYAYAYFCEYAWATFYAYATNFQVEIDLNTTFYCYL